MPFGLASSWSSQDGEEGTQTAGRCRGADKTSLCLHTWASSLPKRCRENNATCSQRNRNGFSPQTMGSVIYSVFPPEEPLHRASQGPHRASWFEERRRAQANKGRFSIECKDMTAGPVWAGLWVLWPQPASLHRDRDHHAFQAQQFPHTTQLAGISSTPRMEKCSSGHGPAHTELELIRSLSPKTKPLSGNKAFKSCLQ